MRGRPAIMGVCNLWTLLSPCGRRTSVDALAYKRLAVDASIWLIQFIKAMREEVSGEMIRNAHLLGLFRRHGTHLSCIGSVPLR